MQALEQPLLQDASDEDSDDEALHDSRRSLASRHSRQSQEGGSGRAIGSGFLSMPTFIGQRSGDVRSYPLQPLGAAPIVVGCSSKSLHDKSMRAHKGSWPRIGQPPAHS